MGKSFQAGTVRKVGVDVEQKGKKRLCVGLLAHVDAGKTTLSEAMLYRGGALRRLGRVDHRDAFLDTDEQERERGITIFSKQAVLELPTAMLTLLDTPGHVDFSGEMERALSVLDCAVLVVSGTDGVQSHTRTVWRLLERRHRHQRYAGRQLFREMARLHKTRQNRRLHIHPCRRRRMPDDSRWRDSD
jgi:small GTP-binding protein